MISITRFPKSESIYEAGKKVIPGGVIGTRRPENFVLGAYPLYVKEGKGAHFKDVDGNEYIDFLAGFGPVLLGHAYDAVDNAAIERIRKGFCFDLSQDIQNTLAEQVIECIPCAEKVIFVLSGSDATTAAIRLARTYTGRDKILKFGYNGWHDWCVPVATGIPAKAREDIIPFTYNDIVSVEKAMEKYKGQVAGVIITPLAHEFNHPIEFPKDGFLQKLRDITKAEGSLLIFDEIRTGFRLALGGAQEYFGVTPDIGVFGKGMANGYAIGMVTGRDDIMMANQKAYISSTFFYNSLPMAASLATINEIREKNVIPHIWRLGEKLQAGMRDILEKYDIPAEVSGPPPMPFLTFKSDAQKRHQERRRIFYTEAIANGIFLHPFHHWYIFFTHTDKDIETTLSVIEKTMMKIKKEVS
jgi:glutamate-1-semialdehyde-2,1-aminomutase